MKTPRCAKTVDIAALKAILQRAGTGDENLSFSRRDVEVIDATLIALSALSVFKGKSPGPSGKGDDLGLIGQSEAIVSLRKAIRTLATSSAPILITGENGTGKERVASAIVATSSRRDKPFVKVNCGALAQGLLESELFGHVKGAFTGAVSSHDGLFARAHEGTLFLDEIAELSPATQVKLLRVLQEGTFVPVGGMQERRVDVRIIAATNRNLSHMREEGSFRHDLYFRLAVVCLWIPPLRERKEDIPLLVQGFIEKETERDGGVRGRVLTHELLESFCSHPWPGNVRELENAIRRLMAFSGGSQVLHSGLLEESTVSGGPERHVTFDLTQGLQPLVHAFEKRVIEQALREGHTMTDAARRLGLTLPGLRAKMERVGVEVPSALGRVI